MNPADIHLKFPDETTATNLLLANGVWSQTTDEENLVTYFDAPNYLTDVIGPIYKATGAMLTDEEGMEYPEMADVGGWHVNMRGDLPDAIASYKITVSGTPYRIWD
jgi:hypothetical protein